MIAGWHQRWWRTAFVLLLVLGNGLMYMHLAQKIGALQASLTAMNSRIASNADPKANERAAAAAAHLRASPDSSSATRSPAAVTAPNTRTDKTTELINRFLQRKQQLSSINPITTAADLSNRMAAEPALPEIEQEQSVWLNETLQQMPADLPKAESLQTTCQGRRCLISAAFASDSEARAWASRYLLESRGRLLKHANTVVVPLGGSDHSVALQLYLY
jgi:hypothetical protein